MKKHPAPSPPLRQILGLFALLAAAVSAVGAQPPTSAPAQEVETAGIETEITLRWAARRHVARYRVQVASDPQFEDIVFDGAVVGLEQKVTGIAPGKYYWRVAPAPRETGRFSRGEPVEISAAGTNVASVKPKPRPTAPPPVKAAARPTGPPPTVATATGVLRPPPGMGWQAAIGRVQRPVPARLRHGRGNDLVAVNSDGTVYALEGLTGVPLWSARYRAARPGGAASAPPAQLFTPLPYAPKGAPAHVVAACDVGVRLLEGETGRELWRASLTGRPVSGSVTDLDGNEDAHEIAVVTEEPSQLFIIEGATGRVVSQIKLQAKVVGLPVPFLSAAERGVAVALESGQLEIRKPDGGRLRGIRFDVPFTTPPLVITGPQGTLMIVGTEHGLLFLNGAELKPLGRVTTENDAPRGRLSAADLDGDRLLEVAMVTRRGRVVVISAAGKISWTADGASDAYSAIFSDLDGDGALDVLVADESVFARGFSGRDGRLIWQVDAEPKARPAVADEGARALRTLAFALAVEGAPLVVSGDLRRSALRAVALPGAAGRAASK